MSLSPTQAAALKAVVEAVTEAVKAAGSHGAPGGVIYSALMASGCSHSQYVSLMGAMVRAGKLRQSGHLYFIA